MGAGDPRGAEEAGDAEVGEPDRAVVVEHEVRRLHVAMHDALAVAIIERLGTCRLEVPPEAVVLPARTSSQASPATAPARHPHRAASGPGRTGSRPSGRSGSARLAPRRAWPSDGGRGRRRSVP